MFTLIINAIIATIVRAIETDKVRPDWEKARKAALQGVLKDIYNVRSPEDLNEMIGTLTRLNKKLEERRIEAIKRRDLATYRALRGRTVGNLEAAGILFQGVLKLTDLDTECQGCGDWLEESQVDADGECEMCAEEAAEMARR